MGKSFPISSFKCLYAPFLWGCIPLSGFWFLFIINSGALAHMCHDHSHYSSYSYHKIDPPRSIYIADNGVLEAVGVGDIIICTHHNGQSKSSLIKGALHLPWLCTSLLSIAKLADAGMRIISDPQHIDLVDIHTRKVKDCALRFHNLYRLQVEIIYPDMATSPSHIPLPRLH